MALDDVLRIAVDARTTRRLAYISWGDLGGNDLSETPRRLAYIGWDDLERKGLDKFMEEGNDEQTIG